MQIFQKYILKMLKAYQFNGFSFKENVALQPLIIALKCEAVTSS